MTITGALSASAAVTYSGHDAGAVTITFVPSTALNDGLGSTIAVTFPAGFVLAAVPTVNPLSNMGGAPTASSTGQVRHPPICLLRVVVALRCFARELAHRHACFLTQVVTVVYAGGASSTPNVATNPVRILLFRFHVGSLDGICCLGSGS